MKIRNAAIAGLVIGLATGAGYAIASTTSVFMGYEIPEVGDPGPTYASNVSDALETIDSHDHTSGKGTRVPTGGLNINADVEFNGFDPLEVRTIRFDTGVVAIVAGDRRSIYQCGGELCYIDESGNITTLTNNGAVNAAPGSISGMTGSASVVYSTITDAFAFTDDNGEPAGMDFGCIRIAEEVVGGKGPILCSNAATAADFAFTFPAALPAANRLLCLDAAGDVTGCTATAQGQALVIATSTSSATLSTTGDAAIGDDLLVHGALDVRDGSTGTASTTGGRSQGADGTNNSTTSPANVGGLAFTGLTASTAGYFLDCNFMVSAAATSTGVQIGVDFNGTVTTEFKCWTWEDIAGTPTFLERGFSADDGACGATGSGGGSDATYKMTGWFETGTATSATVRVRSEVGASNVTVHAGLCTLVPVNL